MLSSGRDVIARIGISRDGEISIGGNWITKGYARPPPLDPFLLGRAAPAILAAAGDANRMFPGSVPPAVSHLLQPEALHGEIA